MLIPHIKVRADTELNRRLNYDCRTVNAKTIVKEAAMAFTGTLIFLGLLTIFIIGASD